jgi:hypothetical protein
MMKPLRTKKKGTPALPKEKGIENTLSPKYLLNDITSPR